MKKTLLPVLLTLCISSLGQKTHPVPVIFDTDIGPDYDDVGALAMLHAFADFGEARILATISSNAFETTAPTLSVLNTYFRRGDIPIGVTKTLFPNKACSQGWAQVIIQKYPHSIHSNQTAEDAVPLYRRILSVQPDSTVTIISTGFFTNLAHLLESQPDQYSYLNGKELVSLKVKQLVSMAARLDKDSIEGYEFNVMVDPQASKKVFGEWPTPITLSGFEIGQKILTGIKLINNEEIQNSPVKDAFRIALEKDNNSLGRNSWDETAVLVAIRGIGPWFESTKINFKIDDDGKNVLVPGDRFIYLRFRESPEEIGRLMEDLMMHHP